MADLKIVKEYTLIKGELYCRMLEGILSRCVGQEEVQRELKEVHGRTCGFCGEINIYADFRERVFIGHAWVRMQS